MDNVNPMSAFCSTWILDALYQVSISSAAWFRMTFLKGFGLGSHLGHVTLNIWTNFHPNIPWRLHRKFCLKRLRFFFFFFFFFFLRNGLDLGLSIQGHHLNKLGSTHVTNAAYQVSRSSAFRFHRIRFLKALTIYEHVGHIGHAT